MMSEQRVESAKRSAVRQRNYRRARERALTKLANAHGEEYKYLLEREKINDEILGKKWIDIYGNTDTAGDDSDTDQYTPAQSNSQTEGESQ